jgi:hypothetical protein
VVSATFTCEQRSAGVAIASTAADVDDEVVWEPMSLDVGACLRNASTTPLVDDVATFEAQYVIAGPGDRLVIAIFVTPNVELADAFLELFDAIVGTLQGGECINAPADACNA